jgi:hypothetical protein
MTGRIHKVNQILGVSSLVRVCRSAFGPFLQVGVTLQSVLRTFSLSGCLFSF